MRRVAPSVEGGNVPQDTVKDLINEDMGRTMMKEGMMKDNPLDEEHYNNAKDGYVRQDGKFAGDAIYGSQTNQDMHSIPCMVEDQKTMK